MSLSLFVLASGSRANASVLRYGKTAVMFDAGLGIRSLIQALMGIGMRLSDLAAVFITHEHTDHIRGLPKLLEKARIPLFASDGTLNYLSYYVPVRNPQTAMNGQTVEVGPFAVRAIPIPHDAAEPLGYHTTVGRHRITLATDLGQVTREVSAALDDSTCVILESNHDVEMLRSGSYPEFLKERILSSTGHLSNRQTATALARCQGDDLRTVVLAHLSEENNDPALAQMESSNALSDREVAVHVTTRWAAGPFLNLR